MTNEELNSLQREVIQKNKASALVVLNTLTIETGEILKIRYYTGIGENIDSLVAVGIEDGVGPSCYTLISDQSIPLITCVLDYKPDVSEMINGAIYLYNDPDSNSYKRYSREGSNLVEEDLTQSFYFTNLSDSKYYYFDATEGSQKIINVSTNLSDKASFQGIINITQKEYQKLVDTSSVQDDIVYLVNNGTVVTNLYYNYMPFDFDIDSDKRFQEFNDRLDALDSKVDDLKVEWVE